MGCPHMSQQPNLFTLKPRLKFNQTQAQPTTKIYPPHTDPLYKSLSRLISLSPKTLPKWLRPLCSAAHTYSPPPPQAVILSFSSRPASTRVGHGYLAKFRVSVLKVSSLHFCIHSSNKSVDPDGVCFCPASKLFRFLFLRGC